MAVAISGAVPASGQPGDTDSGEIVVTAQKREQYYDYRDKQVRGRVLDPVLGADGSYDWSIGADRRAPSSAAT